MQNSRIAEGFAVEFKLTVLYNIRLGFFVGFCLCSTFVQGLYDDNAGILTLLSFLLLPGSTAG